MFRGVGTAMVTPFNEDGEVDFEALSKLVDFQLEGEVDCLVVMGTTGETATLSPDEKVKVLEHVIERNAGKAKVIYGIGGNNTAAVSHQLKSLNTNGVDGILSVSPFYNKPTQDGIYEHYKVLNDSTDLPIIVYNVPGRTSSNIMAETTLRLAELPNISAVKEASGDMGQIMTIIDHAPEGFKVLSGDDAITLPILASGGDGVISVVSNAYPGIFTKMVHAALEDDIQLARSLHYKLLHMIDLMFREGNPGGVKHALMVQGICGVKMRLPLVNISRQLGSHIEAENARIRG